MKQWFSGLTFLLLVSSLSAQKIDINKKTGLVKVNGTEFFYLIKSPAGFLQKDYMLQNLQHEEFAYLKGIHIFDYNAHDYENQRKVAYRVTFNRSGNYCNISNMGINIRTYLVKKIIESGLIVNNNITEEAEHHFIEKFYGNFVTAVVTNEKKFMTAKIQLQGNTIYNNETMAGTYKKEVQTLQDNQRNEKKEIIKIYDKDGTKVATALHLVKSKKLVWEITLPNNNKSITLLYSKEAPLEDLCRFLIENNYL